MDLRPLRLRLQLRRYPQKNEILVFPPDVKVQNTFSYVFHMYYGMLLTSSWFLEIPKSPVPPGPPGPPDGAEGITTFKLVARRSLLLAEAEGEPLVSPGDGV